MEDAVTQAAELDLAEVTSQNMGDASEQIHRKLTELNQEIQAEEERLGGRTAQIVQEDKTEEDERKAETVKEIEAAETQKPAEERYENIPRESRKVGSGAQLLLQNINRVGNVLGILSQSQTSRNAGGGGSDFGGLEPGAAASPDRKDSALTVPESSRLMYRPLRICQLRQMTPHRPQRLPLQVRYRKPRLSGTGRRRLSRPQSLRLSRLLRKKSFC